MISKLIVPGHGLRPGEGETSGTRHRHALVVLLFVMSIFAFVPLAGQQRRPIDSRHPMWLIHVDVWNKADPQKIIDLIPDDVKPYVCMNLSLSCQYDTEKNVYKMPQNAVRTYRSWATVCQLNGMWFTCQPASGGHTHIQDDDLETFEFFFREYPNFLGWNYAEQFWGFDEAGDKSSATQTSRIALFAKLIEMSHRYGGLLTVSFCGNIWSHALNPVGMMKRNPDLLQACRDYPENILWLYKYTTSSCFYNNESVTLSPFIAGLATNYGVRYDNCGWNGALDALLGEGHRRTYPNSAGIGTVMEQTCVNGGAVWDGPELIWTEDFQNLPNTTVDGYERRNWGTFAGFPRVWIDMFRKVIDGTMYIPTREEVVGRTKVVVINDVNTGTDEQKYAAWGDLYDGLYKQTDPFNRGNGQWMDNYCYFKRTGRYAAIPVAVELADEVARSIPVQVKRSSYLSRWGSQTLKVADFNRQYPEVSTGDLYVSRHRNQLVTYTPYTYLNAKRGASARIPLAYSTCDSLELSYGVLSSGLVREYADHIDIYLNNYRSDSTAAVTDRIVVVGAQGEPVYTLTRRQGATAEATATWDAEGQRFTLDVSHMGPVDISIRCSGVRTDCLTDTLPATSLAADLPVQPQPYAGEVIIEAEDMDTRQVRSCVTDPYGRYPNVRGHAGNGFVDMGTSTLGALRHQLRLAEGGDYTLTLRYQSAQAGVLPVTVNGTRRQLRIRKTTGGAWLKTTCAVTLKAGTNTLYVTNQSGLDMYIDQVSYTPAGTPPTRYRVSVRDVEHGRVVASCDEAAEGDTVRFTILPDDGYVLTSLRVVSSVFYTQGRTLPLPEDGEEVVACVMPDDNLTLLPAFSDGAAVYTLDYSNVLSGTLPEGWLAVQENGETHQYPETYGAGARTMAGFGGYQGKALYWRNGYAEYGRQSQYPLDLAAGQYRLTFAMAAWKGAPRYKARILDAATGREVASTPVQTAAPNANGSTSASLAAATTVELPFTIAADGRYAVRFTNETGGNALYEFLLVACRVSRVPSSDGIEDVPQEAAVRPGVYDLSGRRLPDGVWPEGIAIVRTPDGGVRKCVRWR